MVIELGFLYQHSRICGLTITLKAKARDSPFSSLAYAMFHRKLSDCGGTLFLSLSKIELGNY